LMRNLERSPKETDVIQKEGNNLIKDENLDAKFIMADELHEIGLSDEAISRQLNIAYKRR